MENQVEIKIYYEYSRLGENEEELIYENEFSEHNGYYLTEEACIQKSSGVIYENEGSLCLKFQFNYEALEIDSEIVCCLSDLISDRIYLFNGLFCISINCGELLIYKNNLIIQGWIKRTVNYNNQKRVDLFPYYVHGELTNEIKKKLPEDIIIWEFD
jgi:hypothetical protein